MNSTTFILPTLYYVTIPSTIRIHTVIGSGLGRAMGRRPTAQRVKGSIPFIPELLSPPLSVITFRLEN